MFKNRLISRHVLTQSLGIVTFFWVGLPFHIQTQGVRRKSSAFLKSPEAFPRLFSCWRLRGGSAAGGLSAGQITRQVFLISPAEVQETFKHGTSKHIPSGKLT